MALLLRYVVIRIAEKHRISGTASSVFGSADDVDKESAGKVRNNNADGRGSLNPQASRNVVGMIVESLHGFLHPSDHHRPDHLLAVGYRGNRSHRYAGKASHVSHGVRAIS